MVGSLQESRVVDLLEYQSAVPWSNMPPSMAGTTMYIGNDLDLCGDVLVYQHATIVQRTVCSHHVGETRMLKRYVVFDEGDHFYIT